LDTPISDIPLHLSRRIPVGDLTLATSSGLPLALSSLPISTLTDDASSHVSIRLAPRLRGGKGGFGSQLRAAGGRMSSQKTSNNDSCRDLSGRRLSTIKEAKKMAEYLEAEPLRKKAAAEAQKAKLETLERQLGIVPPGQGHKPELVDSSVIAGKKHRFDDTEYLEQSRDLVDGVKSAVAAGLLRKRKKAKLASSEAANGSSQPVVTAETVPTTTVAKAAQSVVESASASPVTMAAAVIAGVAASA